jgi:hypothetical protein
LRLSSSSSPRSRRSPRYLLWRKPSESPPGVRRRVGAVLRTPCIAAGRLRRTAAVL